MPTHSQGNGRNVALPDENRPSWRPEDEQARNRRTLSEEDERFDDDRYLRGHWEDRERREWDRDDGYRTERYTAGPGGYGGGRSESRNQGYPGSFEDRSRERMHAEERAARGGSYYERVYPPERHGAHAGYGGGRGWEPERIGWPRGYGYGESDRDRDRLHYGTGGGISGNYPLHGVRRDPWEEAESRPSRAGSGGGHRGKGPASYHRSDERIREIICEILTEDDRIDATHVEVTVRAGEVVLSGTVEDRPMKRLAEDIAESIGGVKDVQNQLRVVSHDPHRSTM
jgi:hypothetical protein